MEEELNKKLVEKGLEYADDIIKPPLKEVGGIFTDTVRFWRYRNQLRIAAKAKDLHVEYGLSTKKIPVKTLASLMEYSSLEENEVLQDMWANLLANSTDSNKEFDGHFTLITILKEITFEEAMVLKGMWIQKMQTRFSKNILVALKGNKEIADLIPVETDKRIEKERLLIDNLIRLNLIKFDKPNIGTRPIDKKTYISNSTSIMLSTLGEKLIQECSKPIIHVS